MVGIITVRLAKISDAKSLFDWRNDPNVRAASERTKPLIWEDHISWLTHTMQSTTPHVFIGEHDGLPIGVVRFNPLNMIMPLYHLLLPQLRKAKVSVNLC